MKKHKKRQNNHSANFPHFIIFIVLLLIGVAILSVVMFVDSLDDLWKNILLSISSTCFATSFVTFIQARFLPNEIVESVSKNIKYFKNNYIDQISSIIIREQITKAINSQTPDDEAFVNRYTASNTKLITWSIDIKRSIYLDLHKFEINIKKIKKGYTLHVVETLEFTHTIKYKELAIRDKSSIDSCVIKENGTERRIVNINEIEKEIAKTENRFTLKIEYKEFPYAKQLKENFKMNYMSKQLQIHITNKTDRPICFYAYLAFYDLSAILLQDKNEIQDGQNTSQFTYNNKEIDLRLNHTDKVITAKDNIVILIE